MGLFSAAATQRYLPVVGVHATRECDTVVRMSSAEGQQVLPSLHAALTSAAVQRNVRFATADSLEPHVWLEASMALDAVLRSRAAATARTTAAADLVDRYQEALEDATAHVEHEFLASPILSILGAWVGEPDILAHLEAVAPHPWLVVTPSSNSMGQHSAVSSAMEANPVSSTSPPPIRILLVARTGSRQDEATLKEARAAVVSRLGEDAVLILRLGSDQPAGDIEGMPSVVAALASLARVALEARLRAVSAEAEKVRRVVKSTFKSWFGVPTVTKQPMLTAAPLLTLSRHRSTGADDAPDTALPGYGGSASDPETSSAQLNGVHSSTLSLPSRASAKLPTRTRRPSIGSGSTTPLFARDSWEFLSRYTADLHMLAGNFVTASEAYRVLVADLGAISLTGPATAHEASAVELAAIALSIVDGSKREVFNGLERAVRLYARANRRELAVRAALRGADYCAEIGSPEHSVGLLERAIGAIFPATANSRGQGSNAFSEAASGVLCCRIALTLGSMKKHRRASLYAYLAANRFANQSLYSAAALVAQEVGQSALQWPGMKDEIDLVLGRASLASSSPDKAVQYFSGILSRATDATDVEVQSRSIKGLSEAVAGGAYDAMAKPWDACALFPVVLSSQSVVCTVDSRTAQCEEGVAGSASAWPSLEDEVLEDWSHFSQRLLSEDVRNIELKRQRSLEATIGELRQNRGGRRGIDPGGSLEMKIQRMRDAAAEAARRRRDDSLLNRGAVVGEEVTLMFTLRNPLLFPVFVESASAVVTLDGVLCDTGGIVGKADVKADDIFESEENTAGQGLVRLFRSDNFVLMPCSSQCVAVKVVPLRAGVLRFVGVRWLFTFGQGASSDSSRSQVPGFCTLARKGKRLNATRKQRASEVPLYSEDLSLCVDVIARAPRLELAFTALTGIENSSILLRAGEKRRARVCVSNTGSEAVEMIAFRTDTPHVLFLDVSESKGFIGLNEEDDVGGAMVAGCLRLKLEPGAVMEWPAWIFGARSGDLLVRLVAAYAAGKVRMCRLQCKLHVKPSVNVFTRFFQRQVRPHFRTKGGALELKSSGQVAAEAYIMGIEVEHAGSGQDDDAFQIENVAVLSMMGWTISGLPESKLPKTNEAVTLEKPHSALHVNETATIFVILSRHAAGSSKQEDCFKGSVVNLQDSARKLHANSKQAAEASLPERDGGRQLSLLSVEQISEVVMPKQETSSLEATEVTTGDESRASEHFVVAMGMNKNSLPSRESLFLSVRWRGLSGSQGEMFLPPLNPTDWLDDIAEPEEADASNVLYSGDAVSAHLPPVTLRFEHPKRIRHGFTDIHGKVSAVIPAVVPVDVFVRNMTPYPLDVTVSAPVGGGIADGDRGRFWAGHTDITLRAIPPEIERRICLSAVLDSPGRFDLGNLHVLVRHKFGMPAATDTGIDGMQGRSSSMTISREQPLLGLTSSVIEVEDSRDACELVASTSVRRNGMSISDGAERSSLLRNPVGVIAVSKERGPGPPSQVAWRNSGSAPMRSSENAAASSRVAEQTKTSPTLGKRFLSLSMSRTRVKNEGNSSPRKARIDSAWDSSSDTSGGES